jgi:hypothetical protein
VVAEQSQRELLAPLLARYGIGQATPDCVVPKLTVTETPQGFSLRFDDALGRSVHKSVGSLADAAAGGASLVHTDYLAPLLLNPDPESHRKSRELSNIRRRSDLPRFTLDAGPVLGVAFDSTLWVGGSIGGCVRIGPTCLGALVRVWDKVEDFTANLSARTNRLAVHTLLTGEFSAWRYFAPYAGIGLAWTRQERKERTGGGEVSIDDRGTLRLEFGIKGIVPINRSLGIEGRLFTGVQPLANRHTRRVNDDLLPGDNVGEVGFSLSLRWQP